MVDKDLFLHDLAVVAILKNEAPYLQEWLDYHLIAGVDHFYLYDSDSPDNQAEVVKPFVAAGLAYLKTRLNDDTPATFFEQASLNAILQSLAGMSFADSRLFVRELPNLLSLPYPEVKDLRNAAAQIIPQMMNVMRTNSLWREFVETDYIQDLMKTGG